MGGYGGYEGYVKVRGIFHGVVFVRWLTNLILLVGAYSPYAKQIQALPEDTHWNWGIQLHHYGCYPSLLFFSSSAGMGHHIKHYTQATVNPTTCLLSCRLLGYKYAGIINGRSCHCTSVLAMDSSSGGNAAANNKAASAATSNQQCTDTCLGSAAHSALRTSIVLGVTSILGDDQPCGGTGFASVYGYAKTIYETAMNSMNVWLLRSVLTLFCVSGLVIGCAFFCYLLALVLVILMILLLVPYLLKYHLHRQQMLYL